MSKEIDITQRDTFVAMVERLAANPDVDPDKMQKLVDMQMQIMDRNAKTSFYDAMNLVQAGIPSVLPDSRNPQTHSDYASLRAISAAIKPIYTAEGFSASFSEGKSDKEDHIRVDGLLRHRDGHSESDYKADLPLDKTGMKGSVNKTDIHAAGSTFTYGRRYLTCMMFDVAVGFDLDGNQPDGSPIRDHFEIIAQIKQHIADDEPEKALKEWRSLGPDIMDDLWVAPTKGGVFTVVECTSLREASKANPDPKSGKDWQDKLDADDEKLRKELDAQAKAEE